MSDILNKILATKQKKSPLRARPSRWPAYVQKPKPTATCAILWAPSTQSTRSNTQA